MAWLAHLKHAPPVCYYTKFGRSTSQGVGINMETPKIGERRGPAPLEWKVTAPYKHAPPMLKLVALGQTVERIRISAGKKTALLASVARVWRYKLLLLLFLPFKVTQGHRN